ncbi:MAG: efflux RND transporter permease subunit, partial [Bacteroidetes bacterium]|nr:efflux RND transporter permease subunit [Bacteroidota bacterium]
RITLDTTLSIREGIKEIVITLFQATFLVILVVFVFLQNWRATIIPLIAIPVSLIATFSVFPLIGFSINTLSLLGLVLAIGIVVDDAIVVVEAVMHHIEQGLSPRDATLKAMEEVSGPIVATTLVVVAVFLPVGFMGGITGRLYQQFAITIAISVVFSSFNALTLSPALCAKLLRPASERRSLLAPFYRGVNRGLDASTRGYLGFAQLLAQKTSAPELRRDIDRIDFMRVPRGVSPSRSGERLYGTLTTRSGHAFSGYICWDIDEVLGDDVLDGEDERGRDHEIPFAEIASIARNSARSARVTLKSGEELILHGTNDVNSSNNDILVLDPSLGQVRVPWEQFDEVVFENADYTYDYDRFYTSGPLVGDVTTRGGRTYTGEIIWDNDESYTWEMIDGKMDGVDFDIELGLIRTIERVSSQAALVTLFDGRAFELRGTNDVNHQNGGIYIVSKDGDVRVDWDDFDQVRFEKP